MSTVSVPELRQMSLSELRKELKDRRIQLSTMRIGIEIQKEKNHAKYKVMRKDVARVSMVIMELEKKDVGSRTQNSKGEKKVVAAASPAKSASQSAKKPVKRSGSVKKSSTPNS